MMMSCSNATLTSFFLLIFFLKPCYFMRNNPIFLCPEIEKQSLLSFKHGLEDPENVMSSWDGEVNCCKWKGVVCNNLTGHVHRLHLQRSNNDEDAGNGLSGKISSSLLNLKHLIHLDLSQNEFGETIPSFIGSFKKLEYLNLSGAGFHGKIPHTFGNLSNLHTLDLGFLSYTDVNGSYLDNSLEAESVEWLSRLSQLEYLNMNGVDMNKASNWAQTGSSSSGGKSIEWRDARLLEEVATFEIPFSMHKCKELVFINFGDNDLDGILPAWMGTSLANLQILILRSNKLSGNISSTICHLNSLQILDLSNNQFSGKIPESTQLQSLDASSFIGNHLYGPPLTSNCSHCGGDEVKDEDEEDEGDESDENHEIEWFWVFLSSGYAMGLSAVCSALVLKKSWRDAYFGFMEEMWNKLYVYVHVKWARLKNPLAQNS